VLLARPDSSTSAQVIGYALVVSLLVGVARSWELVGARDRGLIASIMTLAAGRAEVMDDDSGTRVGLSVLDLRTALETGSCEPSPVSDSLQDRSRWSQAYMRCVLCLVAARWTDVAPGSCALAAEGVPARPQAGPDQ
jgi:hypothetical protein